MARAAIRKSPGKGTRIDTVYFDVPDLDHTGQEVGTRKVPLDVFLEKKFAGETPPLETTSFLFTVRCKEPEISQSGTDLDLILKAVRGELDKRFRIDWKSWLYVCVDPARIYDGTGGGLTLSWKSVYRGVTSDEQVLMRVFNHHQDWPNCWEIKPWPEQFKDKSGRVRACIEDTPENLQALEAFRDRLDDLRKTLAEFVAPENITRTLSLLSQGGLTMLPGQSQP